jgi:cyclic beta-1,2-glucan synthetase
MAQLGNADRAWELFRMINPLHRSATPEAVNTYRVEPYVIAADIYTADDHVGRGGWTWYTGSASWFYRVGLETLLGFTLEGDTLRILPAVPATWPEFRMRYRHRSARYEIAVHEPAAIGQRGARITLDGREIDGDTIPLADDGGDHVVEVRPRHGESLPDAN